MLRNEAREALERRLPTFLQGCRWFGGKALTARAARIVEQLPLNGTGEADAILTLLRVDYSDGGNETYVLPLAFAHGAEARKLQQTAPQSIVAALRVQTKQRDLDGVLFDGIEDPRVAQSLLDSIIRRRVLRGSAGELIASPGKVLRELTDPTLLPVTMLRGQQSNTSVAFGHRLILKLYRRLQSGTNPEWVAP